MSEITVVHKWQNRGVLFLVGAAVCGCLGYWVLQSWFRLNGVLSGNPENLESVSGLILGLVVELVIGVGSLTITGAGFAWWLLKDLGIGAFQSIRGISNAKSTSQESLQSNPAFTSATTAATIAAASKPIDQQKLLVTLKSIIARLDKLDPPPPAPLSLEEQIAELKAALEAATTPTSKKTSRAVAAL